MIEELPNYITVVFILTTLLTLVLFLNSIQKSTHKKYKIIIAISLLAWMILQMFLSFKLFYLDTIKDFPPKFMLGFVPSFLLMIVLFNTIKGKAFIDGLPLKQLTLISIVRIPVELVLYWLFIYNWIPELMTFSGRNFDILAGISAPLVIYFGIMKSGVKRNTLLIWNVVSTFLLLGIVLNALFSFPTTFQQQAFDQPNLGLLYFPFYWLPSVVVPIVMFTHFVSIRKLIYMKKN